MEKLLIFIKHRLGFLWMIIEWVNGLLFQLFYKRTLERSQSRVLTKFADSDFIYRKLLDSDALSLHKLVDSQAPADLDFFKPHGFDMDSIKRQFRNRAFLMMGAFEGEQMVGYFFLRFFANKKCFVGRLIDHKYRGRGIGREMNKIMYNTAWGMNFRCLSTISKNNKAVMGAHAKNQTIRLLKELKDDYMLVEFVKDPQYLIQ